MYVIYLLSYTAWLLASHCTTHRPHMRPVLTNSQQERAAGAAANAW